MRNRGGFTVVESLIALAISATLFVIIMAMFNGRQGRVEFSQGLRDIESTVLDVANDVRNGYYPNPNQKCIVNSGVLYFDSGVPATQGTSSSCIFAGKILLFDGASSPYKMSAYSLAALRSDTSLVKIDASTSNNARLIGSSGYETKTDYTLPGNISLVKTDISGNLVRTSLLIGLIFDINNVGVESSNKKVTNVIPYIISITGTDIAAIKNSLASSTISYTPIDSIGKTLCFLGNNRQNATIVIRRGPDGLVTSTRIGQAIDSTTGCQGI